MRNFYLQTDGMTGRNTTDSVDGGWPYHRDRYRDASVQATGPFIRDKFWFFGSLHYQRDWDSQPGVDPNTPALNDSRRVFWKFNYNITQNHQLMHGYHNDYYFIPADRSSFTAPSSIDLSHGDNPTPNLVYTGVLSDKTFIEARYSGFWLHSSTDPNEPGQNRVGPAIRGPGYRSNHWQHHDVGREPQLAVRLPGEAVAPDRRISSGQRTI